MIPIQDSNFFLTTLASIGDGVIVTDAQGFIRFLNSEAERLTQWKAADAAGMALPAVFRVINEITREIVESPLDRVIRDGRIVGLANHTALIAKDGSERPIDDSAAPIRNEEGQVLGVVLVFREITERRRAEQMLRQADARKDKFLAILSHELRSPLAPIRMAASLLRSVAPQVPEIQDLQDVIDRQAAQLAHLLDDLLDVSRIAAGKISIQKKQVNLDVAIRNAIEATRPLFALKKHHLSTRLPGRPIYVEGDNTRLSQVFTNILENAAKYTPQGGQIALSVVHAVDIVIIQIRDNGMGIDPERMPEIFEMFMQGGDSLEDRQGGLGIGLSLVKHLVELHHGDVFGSSEGLGKGSTFEIRLPLLDIPVSGEHEGEKPRIAAKALRILVADDNVDSAEILGRLLSLCGHDVRVVNDGCAAVGAIWGFRPDLAILDIGMPKMNGYEVARKIRAAHGKQMVLIAVTGWGQEDDKRRAIEAGFNYHYTKPVDPRALDSLLAHIARGPQDQPGR